MLNSRSRLAGEVELYPWRFDFINDAAAKEVVYETLEVLARLPECVEPDWLERLEE